MSEPNPAADISAIDLLLAVAKHKWLVLFSGICLAAFAGLITVCLPNMYTATTRVLPPQQTQSLGSAMMGQLGPLGSLAGHDLGLKNPNDVYLAMLSSHTVADALIQRLDLAHRYRLASRERTRKKLEDRTLILNGKDGIITVQVEDEDRSFAAELANAYVEELIATSQNLAVSEASQRRVFYEGELKLAKERLDGADAAFRDTQTATGLIKMSAQSRTILSSVASLRNQLAAQEARLDAMRTFATDQNPDYIRRRSEITGLRAQLSRLEQGDGTSGKGDPQVATGKVPQASMEYVHRLRDVKYYELIFELVAKQYELAKIDEGRDAAVIQVLDRALPPEKKSGPARLGWTVMGFLTGAGFATLAAMVYELPLLTQSQHDKLRLAWAYLVQRRPLATSGGA